MRTTARVWARVVFVTLAGSLSAQVTEVQPDKAVAKQDAADSSPVWFGFVIDGQRINARLMDGKVTASRGKDLLPAKEMRATPGRVEFLDQHGRVVAELTYSGRSGTLTTRPARPAMTLGLSVAPVTGVLANALGIEPGAAQHVLTVTVDGAAWKAGIRVDDVLVDFDRQGRATRDGLTTLLGTKAPGDKLTITVQRQGRRFDVEALPTIKPPGIDATRQRFADLQRHFTGLNQGLNDERSLINRLTVLQEEQAKERALKGYFKAHPQLDEPNPSGSMFALKGKNGDEWRAVSAGRDPGATRGAPQWGNADAQGSLRRVEERLARLEKLIEKLAAKDAAKSADK